MRSELRYPGEPNLELFVERLDRHLRAELRSTRRVSLPLRLQRALRALRTRAAILLRGGALVLTSLSILIAVGTAPAATPGSHASVDLLQAPSLSEPSVFTIKGAGQLASLDNDQLVFAGEDVRGLIR